MKATAWEFQNRAMIFGLIFGVSFTLYSLDHENAIVVFANWTEAGFHTSADALARLLFSLAAVLLGIAAFIRTWASSYLNASVVYASEVKTESLVADGPYRRVRNPLYFANVLLAIGMGAMMSRIGFVLAVVGMLLFCYRLILREEKELFESQGERYASWRRAVPRLWPALRPRTASAGSQPKWTAGFKAEFWCWGFAVAMVVFTITLQLSFFFVATAASLAVFWVTSTMLR